MVNKRFWLGILVMVLVFGMAVIGCGDGSSDGGVFTLTDIPEEYNGKYIVVEGQTRVSNADDLVGCDSINIATETITLTQISNGTASIPMWRANPNGRSIQSYSGNDTADFEVEIHGDGTSFEQRIARFVLYGVVFSKGNATKSFNDCE